MTTIAVTFISSEHKGTTYSNEFCGENWVQF